MPSKLTEALDLIESAYVGLHELTEQLSDDGAADLYQCLSQLAAGIAAARAATGGMNRVA